MKLFNAIQITTILTSSPLWLSWLANATFTGHTFAFWLGAVVAAIFFVWSVIGVTTTMSDS